MRNFIKRSSTALGKHASMAFISDRFADIRLPPSPDHPHGSVQRVRQPGAAFNAGRNAEKRAAPTLFFRGAITHAKRKPYARAQLLASRRLRQRMCASTT